MPCSCDDATPQDRGSWRVVFGDKGRSIHIASDDFKHDVWLTLSGDFASEDDRVRYANMIANRLNEGEK